MSDKLNFERKIIKIFIFDEVFCEVSALYTVQKKNYNLKTYSRLSISNDVHFVFNRYDDESSNSKREVINLGYSFGGKTYNIQGNDILCDLRKFLSNNIYL